MNKLVKPGRIAFFLLVIAALITVCIIYLYKLQIIEGAAYYEESQNSNTTLQTVTAARGNILDRYGRLLVSNRECYNLIIDTDKLFALDDPNARILEMVNTVEDCGDTYADELPITKSPPFEYTDMTSAQQTLLAAYLDDHDLSADTTAVELMSYFRSRYEIDNNYSAEDMRTIAGIRYELNVRYSINTSPYVFVEDASIDLISKLLESDGVVQVETSFVREYKTKYAAHILGYVGLMDLAQTEEYTKTDDYALDALVGQDGAELAFESYLHGKDGEARITSTASGTVVSTVYTEEPEPGNHVYLTIDIQIQEAAERALESGYARLQAERESNNQTAINENRPEDVKEDVQGLALVAVDVKTGEPLAIASYPSFDLSTFQADYDTLKDDELKPLFNRALMGAYAPGSTFKPAAAIAALSEKIINTQTIIRCMGVFTKYADQGYAPECWIYSQEHLTHGDENVTTAIRDSCNYFFYTVGDNLGIEKLDVYADEFGFGQSTGIELTETTGNMSHPENHYDYAGKEWTYGDTLQAAIGQSDTLVTPLQLAEYCAAVANGGTRRSASILKSVRSYDYSEEKYEDADEVLSTVDSADYNWSAVQEGMYLVANDPLGSGYSTFFGYQVPVACKTGTAQLGTDKTNNGIFMCYAPYDDPEIAIAVVAERGGSGSATASIAKEVLDAYFNAKNATDSQENENTLLK